MRMQVNEYKRKLADAETENLALHKQLEASQQSTRVGTSDASAAVAAGIEVTDATAVATIALLRRQLDDAG